MAGVGGLCSFIVVFFLSSAWSRFAGIYTLAIQISGRVQDLTLLVQATLSPAAAMRAWRYMNVAHILCYIAVSSNYTNKNFLKPLNDKFQLLSPSDMGRVQAIGLTGPLAMREVLSWVLAVVQQEVDAGRVTPQEAVDLRKEVTQFRGSVGMLLATSEMPIPFVYVSFVLTICVLYPLFFTASVALGFNKNTNIYWLHEIVAAVCGASHCHPPRHACRPGLTFLPSPLPQWRSTSCSTSPSPPSPPSSWTRSATTWRT